MDSSLQKIPHKQYYRERERERERERKRGRDTEREREIGRERNGKLLFNKKKEKG